jgi:sucrose-6-phosphate hydrolase SacC (GH32 family)
MVGDENANGTFVPESTGTVDYGSYYASASFELSDGRRIVWAWVLEDRGAPYGGSDWAGVQALPREVSLFTTTTTTATTTTTTAAAASGNTKNTTILGFQPAKELEAWRDPNATYPKWKSVVVDNSTSNYPLPLLARSGMAMELEVSMTISSPPKVNGVYRPGILVRVGGNGSSAEWTFVGINIATEATTALSTLFAAQVFVDRSKSSVARVAKNSVTIPNEVVTVGVPYTLRIFVDHSVLTVFAPSGKVLTTRIYPSAASVDVQLASVAAPTTFDVTAWGFAPPASAHV